MLIASFWRYLKIFKDPSSLGACAFQFTSFFKIRLRQTITEMQGNTEIKRGYIRLHFLLMTFKEK